MSVDSGRGGGRSRAPSDEKAKPHWWWSVPDGLGDRSRSQQYGVDSRRGGGRSRAPSDGKAKSHWRRKPPDEEVKDEIGSRRVKLTLNAVVVEAAASRSGESRDEAERKSQRSELTRDAEAK